MNETIEKKVAKEIVYIEPINQCGDDDVITYIGKSRGASTKYGVCFPIMDDDEYIKERYNMTKLELLQAGVRQISTRPDYSAAFLADGTVDQVKMQAIADAYKPGSRAAAGPKVTKEAAKMGRMVAKAAAEKGYSVDEIMEKLGLLKAKE